MSVESAEKRQAQPPPGDWLFKLRGEIWGPVASSEIIQRMYKGEVDEATPISTGEGDWRDLKAVPQFLPFLYQAKAAIRAAQAKAEAARAAQRRRSLARLKIALGALALVVISFATSYVVIVQNPWKGGSNLAAWATKHVPLFGIATAQASPQQPAGEAESEEEEDKGINIDQILIDEAPSLVAIQTKGEAPKRNKTVIRKSSKRGREEKATEAETSQEGKIASMDGISNEEITQIVYAKSNLSRLFGCVRQEIKRNPDIESPVTMSFTVNNDGRVGEVRMDNFNLDGGALHECFRQRLSQLKFRPYAGERRNIEIPFNFNK